MKLKIFICTLLIITTFITSLPFVVTANEADMSDVGENSVYYIDNYQQLRSLAYTAQADCRYILSYDITQDDNLNDMEVVIPAGAVFNLDLNGYSIKRATQGNDSALFRVKSQGRMTITDTSSYNTGYCSFSEGYSDYNKAVFFNDGGELEILDGYYEIFSPYEQGSCSVICAKSGYTNIYGGTFDSSTAWGGDTITVQHDAYLYDTPVVTIFDGNFFGKYQSIEASSYGNYLHYGKEYPNGSLHPMVYVLGGNFYVCNGGENNQWASFAYCNNGWGRVIVAEGTVLAKCLNSSDQRFLQGVSKKLFSETIDNYTAGYYKVTAPPMIISEGLDYHYRLLNLCNKAMVNSYDESVYKIFREQFDAVNENIDTINVSEDQNAPIINLVNRTSDHKYIRWYMCNETDYNGAQTAWTYLGNFDDVSSVEFPKRPEDGGSYIVRCAITNSDFSVYEDIVRIAFEPLKTVEILSFVEVSGIDAPIAGRTPDTDAVCNTQGGTVTAVEWYDVTDGRGSLMNANDTFKAGRKYKVVVRVDADANYSFEVDDIGANIAEGTINGFNATAYSS
ncbi:MAG: hypothetical protein II225_00820, partial [Ruminococcus sp.]|nr:hypothetical protein [Ruminococcus sp.]